MRTRATHRILEFNNFDNTLATLCLDEIPQMPENFRVFLQIWINRTKRNCRTSKKRINVLYNSMFRWRIGNSSISLRLPTFFQICRIWFKWNLVWNSSYDQLCASRNVYIRRSETLFSPLTSGSYNNFPFLSLSFSHSRWRMSISLMVPLFSALLARFVRSLVPARVRVTHVVACNAPW